jgi:hypothetical protein
MTNYDHCRLWTDKPMGVIDIGQTASIDGNMIDNDATGALQMAQRSKHTVVLGLGCNHMVARAQQAQ